MANDVSSPFPDLDWPDQAIIGIDAGDVNAKIKVVTIHLSQDVPAELVPPPSLPPVVTYGPPATTST